MVEYNNIRSACNGTDCNNCNFKEEPTCFNTEKRNKSLPLYLSRT